MSEPNHEPADLPIPTEAGELTPQWLTALLQAHGHETVVTAVEATPIGSGQMAGSYRLRPVYADAGGLPATLVAKLATGDLAHRQFGAGAFRNEVRFYRELAATVRAPVPRCYGSVVSESASEFVLLLEDLAPARQGDQVTGCTVAQVRAVAQATGALHGPRWCDETLLGSTGFDLPTQADREMLESVLDPLADAFRQRLGPRLSPQALATVDWFVATVGEWLVRTPSVYALIHGDLRADNIMFGPGGEVTIVDWQAITVGNPLRDIAFLLATSLDVADRRECEQQVLTDYHRALLSHGVTGYTLEQCRRDYADSLIQAPMITVFGCAAAHPTERGDQMFITMLERGAQAIGDLVPGALDGPAR